MKCLKIRSLDLLKRFTLCTFAIVCFGILPACSGTPAATPTSTEAEAVYKAGSYTSEQSTGFATVVITAEFSETSLITVDYDVTDRQETDYFPNYEEELKAMCENIVAQQTAEVDGVSGATLCSRALQDGVNEVIRQASINPVEPTAKPTTTSQPAASGDFYAQLSDWLISKDVASAANAHAFLPGEENTPTEEDIRKILETSNNYQWCHMLTAPHFIVIRDPEEQQALLPEMGVTGDGTVTILVLADGVKDQEYHAEPYDGRDAEEQHYWQMYYCIYEAGEAASMLNLAARSLGYRTRNYGAVHLYNQGVKDQFPDGDGVSIWYAGGNFDYIGGENWDISKYCSPKEGGEPFQHWFGGGYVDGEMTGKYVDVEDNLTMLCAIVVGRIDETDAVSSATGTEANWNLGQKQYNYDFWD